LGCASGPLVLFMKPISVELIDACSRGEPIAMREVYASLFGWMMGICRRYYKNQDDRSTIVQDTFLKIIGALKKEKPQASFEAWSRKILMNTIIDDFRKNKKRLEMMSSVEDYMPFELTKAEYNQASENFDAEELEQMLYRLPEATRCVFNLFALEGFSHAEIGVSLKISEGTSKWHVSEARRLLKIELGKKSGNQS
jgi:RNA polymerase sigma factor (sigma-70 family)